jgi:putative membrane protein
VFTIVFSILVPFGLLDVFADHIDRAMTTLEHLTPILPMLLASWLITWVFTTMEGIGDSSEDPFERSMNDVPMNALCRTIEIDLRELIGDTELPAREVAIDNLLY